MKTFSAPNRPNTKNVDQTCAEVLPVSPFVLDHSFVLFASPHPPIKIFRIPPKSLLTKNCIYVYYVHVNSLWSMLFVVPPSGGLQNPIVVQTPRLPQMFVVPPLGGRLNSGLPPPKVLNMIRVIRALRGSPSSLVVLMAAWRKLLFTMPPSLHQYPEKNVLRLCISHHGIKKKQSHGRTSAAMRAVVGLTLDFGIIKIQSHKMRVGRNKNIRSPLHRDTHHSTPSDNNTLGSNTAGTNKDERNHNRLGTADNIPDSNSELEDRSRQAIAPA
jgi:hypothetical protein